MFVLPEGIGPVNDASLVAFDDLFGTLAKETGAYIEVGIARITPSRSWNQERLYSPRGELAATDDSTIFCLPAKTPSPPARNSLWSLVYPATGA